MARLRLVARLKFILCGFAAGAAASLWIAASAAPDLVTSANDVSEAAPCPKESLAPHFRAATADARLYAATLREERMALDLAALREHVTTGMTQLREVRVLKPRTAYALIEPKLMMSVEALTQGGLVVHYAKATTFLNVGQRVDLKLEDGCKCFLVLLESTRRGARFLFGCEAPA